LGIKPDYLLYNAGMWAHDLNDPHVQKSIKDALDDTGIKGIYKTTTFQRNNRLGWRLGRHDDANCRLMPYCLDLSWTRTIRGSKHYFDGKHFRAHVNKQMNDQLLGLLSQIGWRSGNACP
jgi:hypothetical protein